VAEYVDLEPDETVVGIASVSEEGGGLALGTAHGVVKRVVPDFPANRDEFEVIGLKEGDRVVGAVQLLSEEQHLVFITTDAQLLHYAASLVRPQGRAAGGMAGIKLGAGASVLWFGALDPAREARVITISGSSSALPGTQAGAIKLADFADFPSKGRATGGVRAHRFLKGEDVLLQAWAAPTPLRAAAANGKPAMLNVTLGRRDGSGEKLDGPIVHISGPIGPAPAEEEAPAEE
jgi:DNA gyrase subunit A